MMRPDAKVEKVYLYPKPVDFRKSIDGLAALVELDRGLLGPISDQAPLLPVSVIESAPISPQSVQADRHDALSIEFARATLRIEGSPDPQILQIVMQQLLR